MRRTVSTLCTRVRTPAGIKASYSVVFTDLPNIISILYSGGQADFPASYLIRQCNEITKLSLQGTVVESSEDYGAGSFAGDSGWETSCAGPDGDVLLASTT